jgi:hypothetical protein
VCPRGSASTFARTNRRLANWPLADWPERLRAGSLLKLIGQLQAGSRFRYIQAMLRIAHTFRFTGPGLLQASGVPVMR